MTTTTERPYAGTPAFTEASPAERAAIIAAFRRMADYLEVNPAAPLSRFGYRFLFEAESREDVKRAADALGLPLESGLYDWQAVVKFGPVTYAIKAARARQS